MEGAGRVRAPLVVIWLRSVERLQRRIRRLTAERDAALDQSLSLYADVTDLEAEVRVLRARVAVLADLADPAARSMAASVLKTIEALP